MHRVFLLQMMRKCSGKTFWDIFPEHFYEMGKNSMKSERCKLSVTKEKGTLLVLSS